MNVEKPFKVWLTVLKETFFSNCPRILNFTNWMSYPLNGHDSLFKVKSVVKLKLRYYANEQGKVTIYVHEQGDNRVFRKLTTLTIMAILASEALLREKNPVTKY